jgi:hypothetical protein
LTLWVKITGEEIRGGGGDNAKIMRGRGIALVNNENK